MGEPARGYSWAPFEPGNEVSLLHGAYSPRRVDPLATELVDELLELARADGSPVGYLADPSYRRSLWALARAEARIQLLTEWLMDHGGEVDGDGEALGAANLLNRCEARAESLRSKLGLDPLSRARLGRDVSAARVDMARLFAQGQDDQGDDDQGDDVEEGEG